MTAHQASGAAGSALSVALAPGMADGYEGAALRPFPLLADPLQYSPFTFDLLEETPTAAGPINVYSWLRLFRSSIPGFKRQVLKGGEKVRAARSLRRSFLSPSTLSAARRSLRSLWASRRSK